MGQISMNKFFFFWVWNMNMALGWRSWICFLVPICQTVWLLFCQTNQFSFFIFQLHFSIYFSFELKSVLCFTFANAKHSLFNVNWNEETMQYFIWLEIILSVKRMKMLHFSYNVINLVLPNCQRDLFLAKIDFYFHFHFCLPYLISLNIFCIYFWIEVVCCQFAKQPGSSFAKLTNFLQTTLLIFTFIFHNQLIMITFIDTKYSWWRVLKNKHLFSDKSPHFTNKTNK